jgi:hypothetical protein
MHEHQAPEKLGEVSFPSFCKLPVQRHCNRWIALLHSFSCYADKVFREVGARDPQCAMAHWGVAMTRADSGNRALRRVLMGFCLKEMNLAMRIGGKTEQDILLLRRKFGL